MSADQDTSNRNRKSLFLAAWNKSEWSEKNYTRRIRPRCFLQALCACLAEGIPSNRHQGDEKEEQEVAQVSTRSCSWVSVLCLHPGLLHSRIKGSLSISSGWHPWDSSEARKRKFTASQLQLCALHVNIAKSGTRAEQQLQLAPQRCGALPWPTRTTCSGRRAPQGQQPPSQWTAHGVPWQERRGTGRKKRGRGV